MDDRTTSSWWQSTEILAGVSLAGLVFIALSPLAVSGNVEVFGLPLNQFLASVLVPIAAVGAIFVLAGTQERIDRRHRATDS